MSVYFHFFCFKQKTAYEMRISDWSSDVCSSDLVGPRDGDPALPGERRCEQGDRQPLGHHRSDGEGPHEESAAQDQGGQPHPGGDLGAQPGPRAGPERRSVVQGKSVSVRVDLGGRRLIQNTTPKKITPNIKNHLNEKNEYEI